jgi:hypothetical protein
VIQRPALADAEIAAATFAKHLDELWAGGRPDKLGWRRIAVDKLHEVVVLPAQRDDGTIDEYYVLLGAEYYDSWPPTAAFVVRDSWVEAPPETRWLPTFKSAPGWFGFNPQCQFPAEYALNGSRTRQLICFTGTAQYYMVDHSPPETAIWRQGQRTVAMTLSRLADVLHQPYYAKPSGD